MEKQIVWMLTAIAIVSLLGVAILAFLGIEPPIILTIVGYSSVGIILFYAIDSKN